MVSIRTKLDVQLKGSLGAWPSPSVSGIVKSGHGDWVLVVGFSDSVSVQVPQTRLQSAHNSTICAVMPVDNNYSGCKLCCPDENAVQ